MQLEEYLSLIETRFTADDTVGVFGVTCPQCRMPIPDPQDKFHLLDPSMCKCGHTEATALTLELLGIALDPTTINTVGWRETTNRMLNNR